MWVLFVFCFCGIVVMMVLFENCYEHGCESLLGLRAILYECVMSANSATVISAVLWLALAK